MPAGFPTVANPVGYGFESLFQTLPDAPRHYALAHRSRFIIQCQLSRCGVPTYLVGRELANALWRTKPPGELPLERLRFPYPAIRFVFEEGSLPFRSGHLATLEYAVLEANQPAAIPPEAFGRHVALLPKFRGPITFPGRTMELASGFRMDGSRYTWDRRTMYSQFPLVDCATVADLLGRAPEVPNFHGEGKAYLPPMTDLPPSTLGTLVNLLFFMTAKPDCIEDENVERAERRKHNRTVDALYSPRKIGLKFRLAAFGQSDEHEATGRKLAPGWRCGHWRDVAYGPDHSLRRETWIQPYPYGLDEKASEDSASKELTAAKS